MARTDHSIPAHDHGAVGIEVDAMGRVSRNHGASAAEPQSKPKQIFHHEGREEHEVKN